ncbi:AcrR family transcriptional regulator [Mycolicibacterium sp. BK556]|nr:AcrR family transcriptional regulator [Mycolicibacterium sp. BK556]MBB3635186.1 AcrR family transcriptional regulator [Mycolicibacterium sp. BK607]MBB3748020.1 AcrR family transcriptional regulator [Mycolicibacterium sp. BK634]
MGIGRRTQSERTAAMRRRLLEATVECLIAYGYAGTTTHRIAARAGVTRGAQVHHFRSKEDLVVAAVEHLAEQRVRAALRGHRWFNNDTDPATDVLGFLWDTHQGDMFVATMELWAAALTDDVLASHVARVERLVNQAVIGAVAQLLPDCAGQQALRNAIYTAMDVLRGILVASFADREPGQVRRRWDRAAAYLAPVLARAIARED